MIYLTKIISYFVSTDQDLKGSLKQMFESMADKLDLYPDVFRPAVQKMVANYQKIKTDSQLTSAMHTFGKFAGVMALQQRGAGARKAAKKRIQMKGVGRIPIQPTSAARRLAHMGRGASRLHSGRPKKSPHSQVNSHSESQPQRGVLPARKRRKVRAPHNLSQVVSSNQSLGRTHSSK